MPAKKKLLPLPCPKCGKENGTVQIHIFANDYSNVYCTIRHYNPEKYKNPREKVVSKIEPHNFQTPEKITKKKSKVRGKISCSFRIEKDFALKNMLPLEQDIEDLTSGYFGSRKSIPYTNPTFLLEAIKDEGWHRVLLFKEKARIMKKKYGHFKGYLSNERIWEQLESLEAEGKITPRKYNSKVKLI